MTPFYFPVSETVQIIEEKAVKWVRVSFFKNNKLLGGLFGRVNICNRSELSSLMAGLKAY